MIYKKGAIVKKIFLLEYAFYLIINIDARINSKLISLSHSFLFFLYIILLLVEYIFILFTKKGGYIRRRKLKKTEIILGTVCILYILSFNKLYTSKIEQILAIFLIVTIFLNAQIIALTECFKEIIFISFYCPALMLLLQVIVQKINIFAQIEMFNFKNIFTKNYGARLRIDFGFYNVNAAGNLAACTLCVGFLTLYIINHYIKNQHKKVGLKISFCPLYIVTFLELILTSSRTAIASVIVCYGIYFGIITLREIYKKIGKMTCYMICVIIFCIIIGYKFNYIIDMFWSSRHYAFSNLKIINKSKDYFWGIGLFAPGDIVGKWINGVKGTYLDNYYIYIYLSMGLIGFFTFCLFYFNIGKNIYLKAKKSRCYLIIFSMYIGCLCSGLAETSIMYHIFPSSVIYFSIFLCSIYDRQCIVINNKQHLVSTYKNIT